MARSAGVADLQSATVEALETFRPVGGGTGEAGAISCDERLRVTNCSQLTCPVPQVAVGNVADELHFHDPIAIKPTSIKP